MTNKITKLYHNWEEYYIDEYQEWWKPGANTLWYYNFNDRNSLQITDSSGNNRNLTWWTMPTYSLVSGTNYAGNFANVSWSIAPSYNNYWTMDWNYTFLAWVKPTATGQCYVKTLSSPQGTTNAHQISIIYNYNSNTFEYYDDMSSAWVKRTTIKSWAVINNWYLVWYTREGASVKTYQNGEFSTSITGSTSTQNKLLWIWSSREWDRFKWLISEVIIENKVRTAQEIADYYNQTKSLYWIN